MAYIADADVLAQMGECHKKVRLLNALDPWEQPQQYQQAIHALIPDSEEVTLVLPFYCEYGTHIHLGRRFYANYGCVMIDVAPIRIGDDCLLGPGVCIYTAGHPVHPATRTTGYEYGRPVHIGNRVWIGGSTVILPGVEIGDGTVIGAGSVVTRSIPAGVVAAGNPCRVLRPVTEEDRPMLYQNVPLDPEAWADACSRMETQSQDRPE